jgi:hypothetical protein
MNKLNGWCRLGIVLTVLWIAVVGIECRIELDQGPLSRGWLTDTIVVKTGERTDAKEFSRELGKFVDLVPVDQVPNWFQLLSVLIGPIAALWLSGAAFAWVRSGFR